MYGLLYVLFTFGIPIAVIIAVSRGKKKKEAEAKRQAELEQQRKKEAERLAIELKKEEERKKKIREQEELELLVEKYKDNPRAKKAASDFADTFISIIKHTNRDIRISDLKLEYGLGAEFCGDAVTQGGVLYVTSASESNEYRSQYHFHYKESGYQKQYLLNFQKENIQPISDRNSMCAFVKAISVLAYDLILERYKKDESGSEYSLSTEVFSGKYVWPDRLSGYAVIFKYSAKNDLYQAPAEW